MNQLPSMTFFTDARMLEFWGYVRQLLSVASPMVMLVAAAIAVSMLIGIIVRAIRKAKDDEDDDDQGYEVKHY